VEKGEAAIVGGQVLALLVVVLLLGNYLHTNGQNFNGVSIPQMGTVYWGIPSNGTALDKNALNTMSVDSSSISIFYTLAYGTSISGISASRLCLNPGANETGLIQIYTNLTIFYYPKNHDNYIVLSPTDQPPGLRCTYSITITDSLQQIASWVGTVVVKAPKAA